MKNLFFAICLLLSSIIYIFCQPTQDLQDWSAFVVPISETGEETAFSIFDTSPESPDGTYICYVEFP